MHGHSWASGSCSPPACYCRVPNWAEDLQAPQVLILSCTGNLEEVFASVDMQEAAAAADRGSGERHADEPRPVLLPAVGGRGGAGW